MGVWPRQARWYGTKGWSKDEVTTPEVEAAARKDAQFAEFLDAYPDEGLWADDLGYTCAIITEQVLSDLQVSLEAVGWGYAEGFFVLQFDGWDEFHKRWLEERGIDDGILTREEADEQLREAARRLGLECGDLQDRSHAYNV